MSDRDRDFAMKVAAGKIGRHLEGHDRDSVTDQVLPGEHLYAVCHDLFYVTCVCVDEPEEFEKQHAKYANGDLLIFELYALSEDAHNMSP